MIVNSYAYAAGGYDADAQAFFTAAGISDSGQKSAVNTLVLALKSDGIWSRCSAIYPFVGGSSSSHAVNLKTPGTYDLTFYGGITHSSTGSLWDGTSGYGDSGLIPSSVLTGNDTHLSYYSRTSNTNNRFDMGCYTGVNYHTVALTCYYSAAGNTGFSYQYDGSFGYDQATIAAADNPSSQGFYVGSRVSSSSHTVYKNATAGTTSALLTGDFPSITDSVKIGAVSYNGSIPAWGYGNRECAFASIGAGLSSAQVTSLTNAVQTFQTSLSRQV